jgi:hypothetical protein
MIGKKLAANRPHVDEKIFKQRFGSGCNIPFPKPLQEKKFQKNFFLNFQRS